MLVWCVALNFESLVDFVLGFESLVGFLLDFESLVGFALCKVSRVISVDFKGKLIISELFLVFNHFVMDSGLYVCPSGAITKSWKIQRMIGQCSILWRYIGIASNLLLCVNLGNTIVVVILSLE